MSRARDPLSQGTSLSTDDVDEMHRLITVSSLLTCILDFYRSRIFGTTIQIEGTHFGDSIKEMTELVDGKWKDILRKDMFDSIIAYGICVIRYMPLREKKPKKAGSSRLKFHVIPLTDVSLVYKKNTIDDTMDIKVYPRNQTAGTEISNQDPITRTRVFYTEHAFTQGGRVVSLVALVRDKLLLYERALVDASLIINRMTTPDWGVESQAKDVPVTGEDITTMETGDSGYGQTAQVYQAIRLGQNVRQTEMSRLAAIDNQTHNAYADANLRKQTASNKHLHGTSASDATVPIWMERVGYRFDTNERLVTFPVVPLPGIKPYLDSLVSAIGAAFSLSATLILSEPTGTSSMGQALTSTEQNIKRFVTRYHTMFERFLLSIYKDVFNEQLLEDRAGKVRDTVTKGTSTEVDAIWELDIKFIFTYVEQVPYIELKTLYEDGIIDEETYCARSLDLYGITVAQKITPTMRSQNRENDELSLLAKRQKITMEHGPKKEKNDE